MMKNELIKWIGYLSMIALFFVSCTGTGTELTQKRIDDSYKGRPVSDILVIAITGNEHNRRVFEKKIRFAAKISWDRCRLKRRGHANAGRFRIEKRGHIKLKFL